MKTIARRRGPGNGDPNKIFCWVCLLCRRQFTFLDVCIFHLGAVHSVSVCQVDTEKGTICQP